MQVNLSSNNIGGYIDYEAHKVVYTPEGPKAIADALRDSSSMTSASLLGNMFDDEAISLLLKVKEEKPQLITLCGLKPDQTEADFRTRGLGPADAKLLAPEIAVHGSMTSCDVRFNQISGEGASQLSAAVLGNIKIEKFNEIPIKELRADSLVTLDLIFKGIAVEGAMVVAGLLPVTTSMTKVLAKGHA